LQRSRSSSLSERRPLLSSRLVLMPRMGVHDRHQRFLDDRSTLQWCILNKVEVNKPYLSAFDPNISLDRRGYAWSSM
jgi:hypothetical protein